MTDATTNKARIAASPWPPDLNVDALTLNAILDTAAAGILAIDAHGSIRNVNPAALRLFGYTRDELLGKNVSTLMGGGDRARHDDHIARYLATGESRIMGVGREVTGIRKDGTPFPLHLSIGQYSIGGETYFTGVLIDLTRQKLAEDSLARQQAHFRAVFDCLPDPLVVTDDARIVQNVNPAFTRVFGYTSESLAGSTPEPIFASTEEWQRHDCAASEPCPHRPEVGHHFATFRRPDGELFPGSVARSEIRTPDGRRLGYLELIRDISWERRREAQLMQAQRMEAIGQLTGGIAHDFNNILTVVLGNVELIEMRTEGDDDLAGLAREAREAAEIGARLTDRLLTFGRRQLLETQRINLNEFVLGLMEIIRRTIGEDIDVSTALASDLSLTEADPGQVENAVLNLVINARDAMPKGGRLVIETRNVVLDRLLEGAPELTPGAYVALTVSDTGCGMPPEIKARAFEPFFTTKDKGKGSGLGLATIYGFAKQSGGHATIASASGRGTTVELFLPAVTSASDGELAEQSSSSAPLGGGQSILVVEDNDSVRRLTERRLSELGYSVLTAENGVAALEVLASGRHVDLVFTDVVMPGGITGIDLAREMRRHYPAIAVVLTTGYAEAMLRHDEQDAPGQIILRKPYHQSELALTVAEALKLRGV